MSIEIVLDASAIMAVIADEPESEVVINNNDGNSYKLLPIKQTGKSPFEDIPRIKLDITTREIVELLNECRAGI
jgi:2-succinyl-5-enolpyruvyl-6-hydroxy-3-cyclohexene-1-carboxylate synthase